MQNVKIKKQQQQKKQKQSQLQKMIQLQKQKQEKMKYVNDQKKLLQKHRQKQFEQKLKKQKKQQQQQKQLMRKRKQEHEEFLKKQKERLQDNINYMAKQTQQKKKQQKNKISIAEKLILQSAKKVTGMLEQAILQKQTQQKLKTQIQKLIKTPQFQAMLQQNRDYINKLFQDYSGYSQYKIHHNNIKFIELKGFTTFLNESKLSPKLLSLKDGIQMFKSILKSKSKSQQYLLYDQFIEMLTYVGVKINQKLKKVLGIKQVKKELEGNQFQVEQPDYSYNIQQSLKAATLTNLLKVIQVEQNNGVNTIKFKSVK